MSAKYTAEQLCFLREGFRKYQIPVLTAAFNLLFGLNKTEGQVKATLANHRFTCGRQTGNPLGTYRLFSQDQVWFIKENYKRLSQVELATALNERFGLQVTPVQIKSFTGNHKIHSGRTGCFEKGIRPWNTGTKGLTSANPTSFKKGSRPANWKPLGTERICKKYGYVLVKVAEQNPYTGHGTRYRQKHVYVWEQTNGPVPPGMVVFIVDGNKLNCDIDNLELLSRQELLYLNLHGYNDLPAELRPSMLALAKLATKKSSLEKNAA